MRLAGLLFFAMNGFAVAADTSTGCDIDQPRIERDESRAMLICGPGMPAAPRLSGLEGSGLAVEYAQPLRRCSLRRRERGLYVWLHAGRNADSADLQIEDTVTGQPACRGLRIEVPGRTLLDRVTVEALESGPGGGPAQFRVTIESGGNFDPGEVCPGKIRFPPDPMSRRVTLLARRDAVRCEPGRLTMLVAAHGEQRFPSRVVMELDDEDSAASALAWLEFPVPAFEGAMPDRDARFIEVNGLRTRYFDSGGEKDPLILLHGGQPDPVSPSAQDWQGAFHYLSAYFRVIAYDNIGHGLTDIPADEAGYERYYELTAAHLAGLIDALGVEYVHLVGHSQGGWPVTRVALDRPEQVRCLVNAATVMSLAGDAGRASAPRWAYSLFGIHPEGGPTPHSLMRLALFDAETWNNLSWAALERQYRFSQSPRIRLARDRLASLRMSPGHPAFRALRRAALDEIGAGRLVVPQLLLWGADDRLASLDAGIAFMDFAAAGGRVNMHVITTAGHQFPYEYPREFAAAIAGFCAPLRVRD